jgi:hypothetical protein
MHFQREFKGTRFSGHINIPHFQSSGIQVTWQANNHLIEPVQNHSRNYTRTENGGRNPVARTPQLRLAASKLPQWTNHSKSQTRGPRTDRKEPALPCRGAAECANRRRWLQRVGSGHGGSCRRHRLLPGTGDGGGKGGRYGGSVGCSEMALNEP